MRITTGKYKGRKISWPKGIRPTQDKTRKALFDILGDIEGLSFLELYAGSGAVGLEAASRGAKEITLVEYNRDCLNAISKNIDSMKERACRLYPLEADKAIDMLCRQKKQFDIIFLDPPYYQGPAHRPRPSLRSGFHPGPMSGRQDESLGKKTLQTLSACDILTRNGFIIVQHFKKDSLPDTSGDLALFRQSHYGDTVLSFYKKGWKNVPNRDLSRNL